MPYRVGPNGKEFDSLDEMLAEYRRNMSVWDRICSAYCGRVRNPIRDARRSVRFAYQRVVRGWDDAAAWGMCSRLPKTLGEQLVAMADMAHGCPAVYAGHDLRVPEPDPAAVESASEQWVGDLRKHGEALLALSRLEWFDDGYDEAYSAAQDALRWVADNLGALWD